MNSFAGSLLALLGAACSSVVGAEAPSESTVAAPDGVPIAYEVRGTGEPTLVFVHGWCCDRSFWYATLAHFAPTNRVVALDLGGHGSSGAERRDWTLATLAGDVQAVVDAIPAEHVILVGHSMGGPVALLAAARLAPRVLGVIGVETLHDAGFTYPPGSLEQLAAAFELDFPRAMGGWLGSTLPASSPPELRAWILGRALRTNRAGAISLLRGLQGFDLAAVLAEARVPVRVINAAPDSSTQLATNVAGNRRYADFDASFLPRVGHFLMLERPSEFQAELRRWIDTLAVN